MHFHNLTSPKTGQSGNPKCVFNVGKSAFTRGLSRCSRLSFGLGLVYFLQIDL